MACSRSVWEAKVAELRVRPGDAVSKREERAQKREIMQHISLLVNGKEHDLSVDPETPLLFVLNDELGLRGPRFGCGMAQCGSCTVLLRGQVVRSCVMPVRAVGSDEVTTLEGLGTQEKPHPLQQMFIDEGAAQCGFCLSGVILTAKAVLDSNPAASDSEIREALGGVLCRCFTHTRMLRAIRKYAEKKKHDSVSS
jgi:nicotinate dehydrogenase subunit A